MKRDSGVYAIRCEAAGRVYVGCSVSIRARWTAHRSDLRAERHPNRGLQDAFDRYGEGAFTFAVLERAGSVTNLRLLERAWILRLNAIRPSTGFNLGAPAVLGAEERKRDAAGRLGGGGTGDGEALKAPMVARAFRLPALVSAEAEAAKLSQQLGAPDPAAREDTEDMSASTG